MYRSVLSVALLLLLTPAAFAQQDAKVPDPDPELERKSFIVADGFEVNLFAADPLLAKPIQMNFDPQGRLWLACSEVYPQIKPGQKANDKIIVLEDKDGDGKADKASVFAAGLLIPTGVAPGDGGAYVADSTELVHFTDTDGDGKADKRRVVLSGFGTEDTHHILHTLRWGPDGMLYFNQSIYIHSHIETPHGVRRLGGGGIWQFRPETMQLEVFVRGFVNPWGHHFDRWGQSFGTDGAYGEGINYLLPGASYVSAVGATRIMAGLNPGSPKHCGLEILSGRHLPDDWQGNMITNDFRGHRVCRFVVTEDGAGYASREKPELIKTSHEAFRPIDVKMGPDGAIYIADWYNPIIQHGEVDFRDPRRDVTHGRIWRVTARKRDLVKRPQLVDAKTEELLEAMKAPEDWTRQQARRVLKERGAAKVQPTLDAWVKKLDREPDLLEALWTYQALDVVEPQLLTTLLHARDYHVRAAATRVLSMWHDRLKNPVELLAERVADDHPRVRLEAVRGLALIPSARAAEIAMTALDRPVDRYVDYALWLTMRDLQPSWLPAFQKGDLDFHGNVRHVVFAMQAANSPEAVKPLVALVKGGKVPRDREESVLTLVTSLGGPAELGLVLDLVFARDAPAGRQIALLNALSEAAHARQIKPAGNLDRVKELLDSDNEGVKTAAIRVAGAWQIESLRPKLLAFARDARGSDGVRSAAIEGLTSLGGKDSVAALEELAGANQPAAVRRQAVVAMTALDLETAAKRAVDVLAATPAGDDPSEVFTAFLERKSGAQSLARALADRKLPPDVAKVGARAVRTTGRDSPVLVEALTKAGGITTGPKVLSPEELKALVAEVQAKGDPARGERLYHRKDMACQKCHAIAGAGGQVGPDLVSIGASAPVDYLIESLLQPNKAVKEGFHSLVVTTRAGLVHTGVKVRETKDELVLRTGEDREVVIPVKKIDTKENGPSLMPDGLTDPLTRGEVVDLVRFLSELGKVGPYSVSKTRLVRRWQALEPTRDAHTLLSRNSFGAVAANDPSLVWSPVYGYVSGTLALDDLPRFDRDRVFTQEKTRTAFVRFQLDVSTAGKAKLILNGTTGLTLWLDGSPLDAKDELVLDLASGLRTVTVAIDLEKRKDGLRVELDDVAGSPARVRVVGGK